MIYILLVRKSLNKHIQLQIIGCFNFSLDIYSFYYIHIEFYRHIRNVYLYVVNIMYLKNKTTYNSDEGDI
jgi:hypothetical protein